MSERTIKISTLFVLLGIVLVNYQNCGSRNAQFDGASSSQNQTDPQLGVINQVNTGGIQFLQSKTQLAINDANISAIGMCSSEQEGALLAWKLFDNANNTLAIGKALCSKGSFEVVYNNIESLSCGNLKLSAYFGSREKTDMFIDKICN